MTKSRREFLYVVASAVHETLAMHYGAAKHGYLILYKIYTYDLRGMNTHIFNSRSTSLI